MKVIVIFCSALILLYSSVDSRQCYYCACNYNWDTTLGSCSSEGFNSSCILQEVGNQYCIIRSYYTNNDEQRSFGSVAPDIYQDSHFFEASEGLTLSNTTWLPASTSYIMYGCDWDGCNQPELALYLPDSFQMSIAKEVLDSQLIGNESSALGCYLCSKCINDITGYICYNQACPNGFCYIDEIHSYVLTPSHNCTYTFFSSCQTAADPIQKPNVRIRAIYYIDLSADKQLEIDEVDIICTKDYCNSIETVEYLKNRINATVIINANFQPYRPNDTTTTTTTTTTTATTTTTTTTSYNPITTTALETTTPSHATSISTGKKIIFLYFILAVLLI